MRSMVEVPAVGVVVESIRATSARRVIRVQVMRTAARASAEGKAELNSVDNG